MIGAIIVFFLMVLFAVSAGAIAFGYGNKLIPQLGTNRMLRIGTISGLAIAAVVMLIIFIVLVK